MSGIKQIRNDRIGNELIGSGPISNERIGNKKVRREIDTFLHALDSYPGRFARNPRISFEEHRSLLQSSDTAPRRRV